ncbi:MAG: ABC transporter substrate-binding protein, partial [Aldersonia sp.]|nr:ABC transporter substrate-binding protein [Aldersonia sp.]
MSTRSIFARGMLIAAGGALVLAGCADNTAEEGSSGATGEAAPIEVAKVDEIAATLPPKVRDSGQLVIGVNVPYAPNEFKDDSGKIVGFDVDLMDAVSKVLGVTPVYTESDFDKIIPAIQAGTYDMGMSSFTDSKEREQTVDFTTYFSAGVQWAQQAGKPIDPNNACGKRVAVQATTVEDTEEVPAKSDKCVAEGKPPIEKVKFDRQDDATTALVLGKVDAMSADSPVTAYAIKQSGGKIEPAGEMFDSAPYGWPVAKGSPLAGVLQRALQH